MDKTYLTNINVEAAIHKDGKWLMIVRSDKEVHGAGELSLPGGKVDHPHHEAKNILEETAKREVLEEVGIVISDDMKYVKSSTFVSVDGREFVDVILLCNYMSGEARVVSEEVADVIWMSIDEIIADPRAGEWTKESITKTAELLTLFK